jgi:UDP-N-acetylmuramoyl-L-alanine---L-glutamate ligase
MVEKIINEITGKRILILGYGKEGKSSLNFLLDNKVNAEVGVADQNLTSEDIEFLKNIKNISIHSGTSYLEAVAGYNFILKSPGIPSRKISLTKDQILSSQTDLFLMAFHSQTVGITGTKGKSTTASLIYHLVSTSGEDCVLTGNIGIPSFDIIPEIQPGTVVVFELSANQLENVCHSPYVAVFLNLYEEHLDHFGSFEAYKNAKTNLFKHSLSGNFLIIHKDFRHLADGITKSNVYIFPDEKLKEFTSFRLNGLHNKLNIQAAVLVALILKISEESIFSNLNSFQGLPHRLELVENGSGISFYNDSIATIPEATIAALESIEKVDWLILGGFDRGIKYDILAEYLSIHPVAHIFYTGKAGNRIIELIQKKENPIELHPFEKMSEVFEFISENGLAGEVCLLSPAAASYDQYRNFEHRGTTFKDLVSTFRIKTFPKN